jgi:hypothetical protein
MQEYEQKKIFFAVKSPHGVIVRRKEKSKVKSEKREVSYAFLCYPVTLVTFGVGFWRSKRKRKGRELPPTLNVFTTE